MITITCCTHRRLRSADQQPEGRHHQDEEQEEVVSLEVFQPHVQVHHDISADGVQRLPTLLALYYYHFRLIQVDHEG
jgi:hypothetical protein